MDGASIPLLIRATSKTLSNAFEGFFIAQEVRPLDGRVLCFVVSHDGVSSSDIQRQFNLSKATVSESLNALARQGFLDYVTASESKRAKRIVITDKGKKYYEDLRCWIEEFDRKAIRGLSPEEISELVRLLALVSQNMEGGAHG